MLDAKMKGRPRLISSQLGSSRSPRQATSSEESLVWACGHRRGPRGRVSDSHLTPGDQICLQSLVFCVWGAERQGEPPAEGGQSSCA